MSMSRNENISEKKDVFYQTRHFKRMIDVAKKVVSADPLAGILIFMILISGIGELFGKSPSIIWYILTFVVLTVFSYRELRPTTIKNLKINNEREDGNIQS